MSRLDEILQSPWHRNVMVVTDAAIQASHEFFRAEGCLHGAFPMTTGSISSPMGLSSDSLPVEAIIAGRRRYIADSMQFALELGCRVAGRPTYYVMSSARGEDPDRRHLTEFCHAEVEIAGGLEDVLSLGERYLRHLNRFVGDNVRGVVAEMAGSTDHLDRALADEAPFGRISFTDACALLEGAGTKGVLEPLPNGEVRITASGERLLLEAVGDFTWLTHMPASTVPFYQRTGPDGRTALNADLLAGFGEILGCGERVLTVQETLANLAAQSVSPEPYGWYCEMKDRHPLATAGFGMGIERYLMWLTQRDDIRTLTLLRRHWGEDFVP